MCFQYIIVLLLCVASIDCQDAQMNSLIKPVYNVFHSFDPDNPEIFVPRGVITVDSVSQGIGNLEQSRLSENDLAKLRNAAKSDQLYRIKVVSNNHPDQYVSSFTKACLMYESSLSDVLRVSLDQSGNLVGAALTFPGYICTGASSNARPVFNTTLDINVSSNAPQPDTATFLKRLEKEKMEKMRGEGPDNRSFFAKYWMYIVPVLIFLLISGASNPEGGAAGGR